MVVAMASLAFVSQPQGGTYGLGRTVLATLNQGRLRRVLVQVLCMWRFMLLYWIEPVGASPGSLRRKVAERKSPPEKIP